ncbi:hypothetical protein C0995_000362, partial [Termitomyces sp. Mi166
MPAISNGVEFGYAVMSWWKQLQPKFQKTLDVLLVPIYEGPENINHWAQLCKGGPNGLVSVLTLLLWWGQALAQCSQWQEDSQPLWDGTVEDVQLCLAKMITLPTGTKQ